MDVPEVDPEQAVQLRDRGAVWIDVRERFEWDEARIPDTTHVPMQQSPAYVAANHPELDSTIVVSCLSGARSGQVVAYLRQQGYTDVHNLRGGLQLWAMQGREVERGPER
ncbi:MAG: rhodanese-like domain-containing protein [Thermoleophilia bacterium]|nr:rhodanese-like domain-containing protein [Thermoleophilia bacterium]